MAFTNPPTLTAVRNITNNSYVDLSWDDVGNNGYVIYRSTDGGAFSVIHTIAATGGYGSQPWGSEYGYPSVTTTSWQDQSSTVAGSYQYRIHVYDMSISAEVSPGTLSGLVASLEVGWVKISRIRYNAGINVTWEDITGETSYKVYRSQDGGAFTLVQSPAGNSSLWNDATANHLKVYQYKVAVVSGASETNGVLSNTLNAEPCRSVTGLTATKNGNIIDLAWTNTEQGDYCHVYRGINGAGLTYYGAISPASVTYQDTDIQVGKKYRYGVLQGTTTGGGVLAVSNEESINFRITATWARGAGTLNDEFFELSRKLPEINATISTELTPVFVGAISHHGHEYTPLIRTENTWQAVGESLDLDQDDTAFNRAMYYVYGVRARDARNNWSARAVASIQG